MGTVRYTYTSAWDAGARTTAGLTGDGRLTFSVGSVIGVVCGFSPSDRGVTYQEITHGFYLSTNKFRVIESGKYKTPVVIFTPNAVFKLERSEGVVRYYVDDTLVYSSSKVSEGVVYGDCSLFHYLDSIIDAAVITIDSIVNFGSAELALGVFGVEGDWNQGTVRLPGLAARGEEVAVLTLGPLWVNGSEADAAWGHAELGPLSAGNAFDINAAWLTVGPLWAGGAEADAIWGRADLGPLTAEGQDEDLLPEYSAGAITIGPLYAYGYEGYLDETEGDVTLGSLWAQGVEGDATWGEASLGPVSAFGYSLKQSYLITEWPAWTADIRELVAPTYAYGTIAVTWPSRSLTSRGESSDGSAYLTWPVRTLLAYGGGTVELTWPTQTLTLSGTLSVVGTAELTWPERGLSTGGVLGTVGTAALIWPERAITAYSGGEINAPWPARTLTVSGVLTIVGKATLTWPAPNLLATGLSESLGTLELTWPTPALTVTAISGGVGTGTLSWPVAVLTALGTVDAVALAMETTYAINLTTGAVTQLILGAFEKLVVAHGRLYGLRDGVLIRLSGEDDQGADIVMTVRLAPQQFGTYQAKRLDGAVYLNTRETDGVTLTLLQDETTAWTYQTPTDTAPALGTHRVKVGRGITFHSLGVQIENRDGGALTLGGLEVPVYPLARKPR